MIPLSASDAILIADITNIIHPILCIDDRELLYAQTTVGIVSIGSGTENISAKHKSSYVRHSYKKLSNKNITKLKEGETKVN